MKRAVGTLVLLVAMLASVLGAAPTRAATKISSCPYTITAPGTYAITQDLTCSGTAITIAASKVDLHLNGHTISGSGAGDGIYVERQSNVSIHNGTIKGFNNGVEFQHTLNCKVTSVTASQNSTSGIDLEGASANTVTGNTASGNGFTGIDLEGASLNTVTDNTTTQNGDRGLNVRNSSGNTVAHNTCDRNGSGIDVDNNSHGNTVARNSCTGNGDGGIRLLDGPTRNTIQDNKVSGNFKGIWLALGAGVHQNTIKGNTATLNILGIWLDAGATGNTLQGNTALNNRDFDLKDDNSGVPSTGANTWSKNKFATKNGAGAVRIK